MQPAQFVFSPCNPSQLLSTEARVEKLHYEPGSTLVQQAAKLRLLQKYCCERLLLEFSPIYVDISPHDPEAGSKRRDHIRKEAPGLPMQTTPRNFFKICHLQ